MESAFLNVYVLGFPFSYILSFRRTRDEGGDVRMIQEVGRKEEEGGWGKAR
jgi:hypothetical protein